jgi:adenine-specific DNA-methyltransferase
MAKRKRADVFPDDAPKKGKTVETLTHEADKRRNIPTAEMQSVMKQEQQGPIRVEYDRRNRDLDPQLVWRGKDEQDWSDLVVNAPPLYIQEKVHPKVLIDDLLRQTEKSERTGREYQHDLFHAFNGVPEGADRTDFYQHDQNWSNRMILGDSLQVMASLAEREGLRGKVQCIYLDPPYGIKFNSNFQWSTTDSKGTGTDATVKISRESEQVKAFRDTWRDGIHSYLTYLRDRLALTRDLLSDSGSLFVQIGDDNVHLLRSLLDEVFGSTNCCGMISYAKTSGAGSFAVGTNVLPSVSDFILWYAKRKEAVKYRQLYVEREIGGAGGGKYTTIEHPDGSRSPLGRDDYEKSSPEGRVLRFDNLTSQTTRVGQTTVFPVTVSGRTATPTTGGWKTNREGMRRLVYANRVAPTGGTMSYVRYFHDFAAFPLTSNWPDLGGVQSRSDPKVYVVQTATSAVRRCVLMTTDPGDLVLDPTCGSGTTAYVAEQWGRRWITIDTSRVALALARARVMGARYPYYLLSDSREGQNKEADLTATAPSTLPTRGNVRFGFVYERVPHVTLKSIANNAEIDVIYDKWQAKMEPLREDLNKALKKKWEEWEIPREADAGWSADAKQTHAEWWTARIARQKEIDASIAAKAEYEYLYDKPYEDKKKVRVAGPFTVESLSPHRVLGVDENDNLIDPAKQTRAASEADRSFEQVILENLKTAGVQQAHKADKIEFTWLVPWPGSLVCAEGHYEEGGKDRRAAVFIGPEFGTVTRPDLVAAAREAADAGFDALISCAFNYEAHATEFTKLGRIPVLKARMNADLHMAEDLKNTGKGNLFVIFGEPDIDLIRDGDDLQVRINGVDVFHPNTGEVRSDGAEGIACWFIDTDYNEESFFVRHAYFLGANDPYGALKTTLKAEINPEAWETLNSDTSRPFPKPKSGRIAVKVINHLGDEVMKVFKV